MELGPQAQEVELPLGVLFFRFRAIGDRVGHVAQLDQLVSRHEGFALDEGPLNAVVQGVGGEGLQDVVVGGQLGSADDTLVLAFAGDHDEQGRQGNDRVVAQVFEEVLAVLTVADVVFAEDQVVAGVTQLAHGDPGGDGKLDFGDAGHVEHVAELGPHAGVGFDDEGGDGAEFDHGGRGVGAGLRGGTAARVDS